MHNGPIWRIGVDKNCKRIATSSVDKTVRLWKMPSEEVGVPQLAQILRSKIGVYKNNGKFRSVAISPDGKFIAAGAWAWDPIPPTTDAGYIYIFDRESGDMLKAMSVEDVPNDLAFSQNGEKLAAAFWGGAGERVWNTKTWEVIGYQTYDSSDDSEDHSYGLAFDSKDRLYTVAYDGLLRRYDSNFWAVDAEIQLKGAKKPYALAIHPNDSMVAIAYNDDDSPSDQSSSLIEVYLTDPLRQDPIFKAKGINTSDVFLAVTWSPDGKRLFGGGKPIKESPDKPQPYPLYYWEHPSFGDPDQFNDSSNSPIDLIPHKLKESPTNTVIDLVPCGDTQVAYGTHDPAFFALDANGNRLFEKMAASADMRGKLKDDFTVSERGTRVRFNLTFGGSNDYVLFDLDAGALFDSPEKPNDLFPANTDSLEVKGWKNSRSPTLNGKKLKLSDNYEMSRSLAIRADNHRFVIGAEWSIKLFDKNGDRILYDKDGNKIENHGAGPGIAWGVNIPQKAELVVVAYGDGTIRWLRLSDLEPLLALYVYAPDPSRWIAWTPKGYYMASGGGEFTGWHVNRERDQKADYYKIGDFRKEFDRPDIVKLVLQTLNEDTAINEANKNSNRPRASENVAKNLPPIVSILSPQDNETISDTKIQIKYSVRSDPGDEVTMIEVLVDGKNSRMYSHPEFQEDVKFSLQKRQDAKITLIAYTETKGSEPTTIRLKWAGKPQSSGESQPVLRAVIVGVSDYDNKKLTNLNYADDDAVDIAKFLQKQEGYFYKQVLIRSLINETATKKKINDEINWLQNNTKEDEIALFFYSGHGANTKDHTFFLLPFNSDGNDLHNKAINGDSIMKRILHTPGKKLVIFDACRAISVHTGAAVTLASILNTVLHQNRATHMFTSSESGKLSYECKNCQNGYFSFALLEALSGKADVFEPKNGLIETDEALGYIRRRVKARAEEDGIYQHPDGTVSGNSQPFPFAKAP